MNGAKERAIGLLFFFFTLHLYAADAYKGRIIDGTPVPSGALPWQVILKKDAGDSILCGGSIISAQWVLTAAHCTYGLSSVFLIFGTIAIDTYTVSATSQAIYIHPQYNPTNLNNDVSTIQLPSALTFSSTIQPISLVSSSQASNSFVGSNAIIAGFGYIDDENLDDSSILLSATVTIINNSDCAAVFGSAVVIDSTLCGEGADGTNQSICTGDSGGPLVVQDSNGNSIQIGINSFVAKDACTEGYPQGFARLTSFLDFVSSSTGLTLS